MPDYYPRAKVRLIVRFDEFGTHELLKQAPPKPVTMAVGTKDARTPLKAREDNSSTDGIKRFILEAAPNVPAPKGAKPQKQITSKDGLTHALDGVIPKSVQWNQNGIRTADTCTIKFRYVDLPIDPRTVRSCAIQVFLGTISSDEHARALDGDTRKVNRNDGTTSHESLDLLPDEYVDRQGRTRSNLRFEGFVDTWDIDWPEDGSEPLVVLACRDNTQLLIDQDVPAKLVIAAKKGIDEAIADYLANFPAFQGLTVEYRPAGVAPPVLETTLSGTAFKPQLGPPPSKGGGAEGGDKLSVWDYLTDVCGSLGHTVRIEGTALVIQRVSTIVGSAASRREGDTFQGRTVDGKRFEHRRLIYGHNIMTLKVQRSFARKQPTNVEVRCYSPRRKKVLVVRYPNVKDKRVATSPPGDGGSDQKWLVWRVSGIEDEKVLLVIAEDIYNSIGRNEITVGLKTKNLASFGGDNLDPDILDMRAGDSFELLLRRTKEEHSTITHMEQSLSSYERSIEYMRQLGFAGEFAKAYAKAYTDAGFQTVFRLRQLAIDYDSDNGIALDLKGINYVEVRVDFLPTKAGGFV